MSSGKLPFPTPLYEKYRPRRVQDFLGLAKPKIILAEFIKRPYDSAWMFLGPPGLGKTTIGMAIAEQINAELHLIPSRKCDLDTIDSVTRMCHTGAFNFFGESKGQFADWHVVLIDEGDLMTEAAQSSLLSKTDSTAQPPRTIFIITTNSVKSMDPRFLSRFRVIDFEPESLEGELEDYLKKVYKKEGGRHPIDYEVITKNAHFNVRDCLMKLEVELLIGTKRKGFSDDMKIIEAHKHECKKCHKPWRCVNIACELPHAGICPACGGATTVGSHRGKKAWVTIRKKIADELLAKQNKKKVKK